jgi:tripartite-type tricarboxylate transporter receptor subunit TctC
LVKRVEQAIRTAAGGLLLLLLSGLGPLAVRAEDYPSRTIRLIVPTGPGGASDIMARAVAQKLSERLGQSVVIENRAGAMNMIGNEMVSHAAADGYTLLWGAGDMALQPLLMKSAEAFDPVRSLKPIGLVVSTWGAYAVNPKIPATTLQEFVTYAKSRPGQIRYGTNGTGGSLHLAIRLLEISAGLDLVHVPYRNITQVNLDVISGEIDMASLALPNATANRSNVRLLAQTGSMRHPLLADVPTTAEAGFPNVAVIYWFGLFAPPATSAPIVSALARALGQTLEEPALRSWIAARGAEVTFLPPADFVARIEADKKKWRELIPAMGLKPE